MKGQIQVKDRHSDFSVVLCFRDSTQVTAFQVVSECQIIWVCMYLFINWLNIFNENLQSGHSGPDQNHTKVNWKDWCTSFTETENAAVPKDQNVFEVQEHTHCSLEVQLIILRCQFQTMVCKTLKTLYLFRPFRR